MAQFILDVLIGLLVVAMLVAVVVACVAYRRSPSRYSGEKKRNTPESEEANGESAER